MTQSYRGGDDIFERLHALGRAAEPRGLHGIEEQKEETNGELLAWHQIHSTVCPRLGVGQWLGLGAPFGAPRVPVN